MEAAQIIGNMTFELANLKAEYAKLLGVLRSIKDGEITPDRIAMVNLETQQWSIVAKEEPKKNGVHNRLAKAK